MLEFVYRLNLPSLIDVINPDVHQKLFDATGKAQYKVYDPKDFIKPEWLNFNGVPWDILSVFFKKDFTGDVHLDDVRVHQSNERARYAINWIHGGTGNLEYWLHEDVEFSDPIVDLTGIYKRINCKVTKPAYKVYNMEPGAYLINASVTHRATGTGDRYAVSMRSNARSLTWSEAVDLFKDYIVS